MTNLEQLLQQDLEGEQREAIILKFKQAQSVVKRKLDLGCSPLEYQILLKQQKAYQAALNVMRQV